jgi:hypothetical protein
MPRRARVGGAGSVMSPYCHPTRPPPPILPADLQSPPPHHPVGPCPPRAGPHTRAGPATRAGPVLVSLVLCTQLTRHQPSALGCEGRVVGRPEHAPAQAQPQYTPGFSPSELLCGATGISAGDAGSVRWIAFLGRACRRHRQLLSIEAVDVCPCRSPTQYLPHSAPCEPLLTWAFANALVIALTQHNLHPTGGGRRRARPDRRPEYSRHYRRREERHAGTTRP